MPSSSSPSSHHRTRSVVPIGGQPFVSPYAAYQRDSAMSSSSSASGSNMGLGITISSHGSSSSSSAGSDRSSASPTALNFKHVSQFGTSPSSPSSPSSSSTSSSDAHTSVSPSASATVSPLQARHEAAMRYAAAMHSHTTAMWQEERDNIERTRLGHGHGHGHSSSNGGSDAAEDRWSVSGLLRGRSGRRKNHDKKEQRLSSRKA